VQGLTRDDSSLIAFVEACFLANAISPAELRLWAEQVVVSTDVYPNYVIELADFDQPRFHIVKLLGFTPDRTWSHAESLALTGIAHARGREVPEGPGRDEALTYLGSCPHIRQEFERVFPFIALPAPGQAPGGADA
jgi:hypothetical protein